MQDGYFPPGSNLQRQENMNEEENDWGILRED